MSKEKLDPGLEAVMQEMEAGLIGPTVVGVHMSAVKKPRKDEPRTELSQDERVLQDAASEVDEQVSRQSRRRRKPGSFEERYDRLDRKFDELEDAIWRYRDTSEQVSNHRIDRELDELGL